jgi:signal transduction histidine kinase
MRIPMPEECPPAEVLPDQTAACHWIVNGEGVFERVYGDTVPLFGKPLAELAGRSAASVIDPAMFPVWQERFRRAFSGEFFVLREQREDRVWSVAVFPLHPSSGTVYVGCVVRDISDFVRANLELRRTVMGALKSQDSQRARTAEFLHNVVGQNLAALGLRLDLVRMDLAATPLAASGRIEEIQALLESIMEQVRNFSYELNPSAVERVGLRSALERLAARVGEKFAGTVRVDVDSSVAFQPGAALALYEIAEEAVENAANHSGCSSIEIAVQMAGGSVALEVRDNGHGFDPSDMQEMGSGLGLLTMEHYAAGAGLSLSISSSPQTGTVVRVAVPEPQEGRPC